MPFGRLCFSSFGVCTILVKFLPKNFIFLPLFLNGLLIHIFNSNWLLLIERIALIFIHLPCPHDKNPCSNSSCYLLYQIWLLGFPRYMALSPVERAKFSSFCHICRGYKGPSALAVGFQAQDKSTFPKATKPVRHLNCQGSRRLTARPGPPAHCVGRSLITWRETNYTSSLSFGSTRTLQSEMQHRTCTFVPCKTCFLGVRHIFLRWSSPGQDYHGAVRLGLMWSLPLKSRNRDTDVISHFPPFWAVFLEPTEVDHLRKFYQGYFDPLFLLPNITVRPLANDASQYIFQHSPSTSPHAWAPVLRAIIYAGRSNPQVTGVNLRL